MRVVSARGDVGGVESAGKTRRRYPVEVALSFPNHHRPVAKMAATEITEVCFLVPPLPRQRHLPTRTDTKRSYEVWISNHIMPKWGDCSITNLDPRPVELWLASLPLAPKSKAHIRGVLRNLWDFAAWSGEVPRERRNPMELVRIKGASKRTRNPRSLTVEEFQKFAQLLSEPFRTMALLCCCLGLRISEALVLKWSDVDWLDGKLSVERGIVAQHVDDVKTAESRKKLVIDRELLTA